MAKFTETEQTLLESVQDDRLKTSLAQIRQAMEDIWATDAPRIIQDYTDHGVAHAERLAHWVGSLIAANDGRPLSTQEMYLLLAGIYLHDIGMQCDVVKFSEIRETAEKLGAKFEVSFSAQTSNRYTLDEQKAIRKNHQYLSAAWLDYASRTGETVLGPAASIIPEELIDDLIDICIHHTKLAITNCPLSFKYEPNERKQLLAALLRFADELDIDSARVKIETVKTYSLSPYNSLYWWLHNQTKIVLPARNVILLTIRLHPDDVTQYGILIHTSFITEFLTKNQPVLTVLAQNGIPIHISSDSKVLPDNRMKPLPPEIVQALHAMQTKHDPLASLADEIRTWLRGIRYEVSDPQRRNERIVDMFATLDQGTVKQRVLVRCIDGEIMPVDVDILDKDLDRKTPQGWLISDKRVSDSARRRASEDDAFKVFNLSEFLRQLVWGPYFDSLTALVEKDRIPELYVDLACYKQGMDDKGIETSHDRYTSLDNYIDEWLKERGKVHISLLGEFGTGKTWFCRHYAQRQLERYLQDPTNERLPLLITLRAFAKAMTPQQLINDALLEQYKLPFLGSAYEIFQEINRRGKLLLILDGFDEMARQVDYQTVIDNFWQLTSLVNEASKVILTSRTEYFRWAKESEKILGGEEYGRRMIFLTPPKFEVLYLEPLNDDQIHQVIAGRKGVEQGLRIANQILNTQNLAEMARKPILVELLLAALDEVNPDVLENPAHVYLYATNKLLLRNIDTKRTFTSTSDKLFFLFELAWEMIKSGELRIHYTSIPDRIKGYFGERIKDQHELDNWDFDLRNQTLLHRDAAGYYEFAHKSLAEYFVAFKFAAELGCLAPSFSETYCEEGGKPCTLPITKRNVVDLADTFGVMRLSDGQMLAVRDLLPDMVTQKSLPILWAVVNETRDNSPDRIKYVGGNIVTLLRMLNASFKHAKLARTILTGADLHNADLTGADLSGANLRGANLNGCILQDTNCREADMNDIHVSDLGTVDSLQWSPQGNALAVSNADGRLRIWDVPTGQLKSIVDIGNQAWALGWNPTGTLIAIGGKSDVITIWDAIHDRCLSTLPRHGKWANRILYIDNLHLVSSDGPGGTVRIWSTDPVTIQTKRYVDDIWSNLLSLDESGKYLLCGGRSGHLMILSFPTLDVIQEYQIDMALVSGWFVKGYGISSVIVSGQAEAETHLISVTEKLREREELRKHQIASVNLDTGETKIEITIDGSANAEIAPNGRILAIAHGSIKEKKIQIWQIRPVTVYLGDLDGHLPTNSTAAPRLSFSPDSKHLASGGDDAAVRVWDVDPDSFTFRECTQLLEVKMNCDRMQIGGAHGIDQLQQIEARRQKTVIPLEFFAKRGALLDDEQKEFLTQLMTQSKATTKTEARKRLPKSAKSKKRPLSPGVRSKTKNGHTKK
jgi:WD40 repeat protein